MKGGRNLAYVAVVVLAIGLVAGFASDSSSDSRVTGYTVIQSGQSASAGTSSVGNPTYGALTGNVEWTIVDENNNVVSTEGPNAVQELYFVRLGENIDWTVPFTCNRPINGALNIDADGAEVACLTTNYATPTATECDAELVGGTPTLVYRTFTNLGAGNEGCFAAKLPAGNYDMYV